MRINKYVAQATGLSRRTADSAVTAQRVEVNGVVATPGATVEATDTVTLDGRAITPAVKTRTIMLNKPRGYVCSRNGQGSATVYELLPAAYASLKPVGRLDKDSSGLLLLTNDGDLANQLTHPRYAKTKVYQIELSQPLQPLHQQMISDHGIQLDDGPSRLHLQRIGQNGTQWRVTMQEGRNRQIRRTFASLGYTVTALHRTQFGSYQLQQLAPGQMTEV